MVPLAVFTALSTIAAGGILGVGIVLSTNIVDFSGLIPYLAVISAVAFCGTLISLLHLGRKERFLRAILGISHSWLSREVWIAGIFTAATVLSFLFSLISDPQLRIIISLIVNTAAAFGVTLTWTIGMVYQLSTRITWKGMVNASSPFLTALLLGLSCTSLILNASGGPGLVFIVLWIVDFGFAVVRSEVFRRLAINHHRMVFARLISLTRWGYSIRIGLSFGIIVFSFISLKWAVVAIIIASIILDRCCFYSAVTDFSPRSEISVLKSERMKKAEL